jgi:hypothetical protein
MITKISEAVDERLSCFSFRKTRDQKSTIFSNDTKT